MIFHELVNPQPDRMLFSKILDSYPSEADDWLQWRLRTAGQHYSTKMTWGKPGATWTYHLRMTETPALILVKRFIKQSMDRHLLKVG